MKFINSGWFKMIFILMIILLVYRWYSQYSKNAKATAELEALHDELDARNALPDYVTTRKYSDIHESAQMRKT